MKKPTPQPPGLCVLGPGASSMQVGEQRHARGADESSGQTDAIRGVCGERQIDCNNKCQKGLKRTKM